MAPKTQPPRRGAAPAKSTAKPAVKPAQRPAAPPPSRGATQVPAIRQSTELSADVMESMESMAGEGHDNATREDLAIPFLGILQSLSPQVNKNKGEYIEGAEAGMIFNNVTGALYSGETGVLVVPVAYTRSITEWNTRDDGGGFVADHGTNEDILRTCTRDDRNRDITPDGTEVVKAGMHFVYLVDGETGAFEQAIISMAKTQRKKSKKWLSTMAARQLPRSSGQGTFNPPSFGVCYRLTTIPESNDQGDWYGWSFKEECLTPELPGGADILAAAKQFRDQIAKGAVQVSAPVAEEGTADDPPM